MTDPLDEPPVVTTRTIVCQTDGCENEGVEIELECVAVVFCGVCGQLIEGSD